MPNRTLTLAIAAMTLALAQLALSSSGLAQSARDPATTGSIGAKDTPRDGGSPTQSSDTPQTTGSTPSRDPKEPSEPAGGAAPNGGDRSDAPREPDVIVDLPIPQRRPAATVQRAPQPPIPRVTAEPPARAGAAGKACGSLLCPPFIILGTGM